MRKNLKRLALLVVLFPHLKYVWKRTIGIRQIIVARIGYEYRMAMAFLARRSGLYRLLEAIEAR